MYSSFRFGCRNLSNLMVPNTVARPAPGSNCPSHLPAAMLKFGYQYKVTYYISCIRYRCPSSSLLVNNILSVAYGIRVHPLHSSSSTSCPVSRNFALRYASTSLCSGKQVAYACRRECIASSKIFCSHCLRTLAK